MKFENITLSHEHIRIDLAKGKNNPDCLLNLYEDALDEMKEIYQKGVRRMVDCSNHGIGVDWTVNEKLSKETGIEIINSTGFYKDPFLPEYFEEAPVSTLVDIMLKDLASGAKVIGEVGTSKDVFTKNEQKLFLASAIAQSQTNAVLITHTSLGTLIAQQVDFLKKNGVAMNKVILSHVALGNDLNAIIYALDQGANVAFDTIGKISYLPDQTRISFIQSLIEKGYQKQLLMSMDITRKSHLKKNGGVGYAYFMDQFLPQLVESGVDFNIVQDIVSNNFSRILEA